MVKTLPAVPRNPGSIPGPGRSPGEGNGSPLQIPALRIAWTEEPGGLRGIHGVAKSQTRLSTRTHSADCITHSVFQESARLTLLASYSVLLSSVGPDL